MLVRGIYRANKAKDKIEFGKQMQEIHKKLGVN